MSSKEKKAAINRILKDAQKTEMPSAVTPMNFKLRPAAFDSEDWIFEIKWDGFRMLSFISGNEVKLRSRNNSSFDKRFHSIKEELQSMNLKAVLDGKVVALDESGCSDFDKLLSGEKNCIAYYVFDILWYDGFSLMNLPLLKRKELLKLILPELLMIAAQKLMVIPSAPLAQNHFLCLHFLNLKQYCKDKFKKEQETE